MPHRFFDQYDKKVSIVVPVFNETDIHKNIQLLVEEVKAHFKHFELIIVSDGSNEETVSKIKHVIQDHMTLIALPKNEGKGAAVRKGFSQADGEFIFFIDGGMEIHPRELRVFLGLLLLYDADIVVGSKRHPQSQVYYPFYRRFLSMLFQKLISLLFQLNITDSQVGMKLFRREVIQSILPQLEINRYGFDLEILSLAKLYGYGNVLEAPVRLDYFLRNKKGTISDILHVIKVGLLLLSDTIHLFIKIKKIENAKKNR